MPVLTPIVDCDEDTYMAIAKAKKKRRRTRLLNAWPIISQRYQDYVDCAPNLENISPCTLTSVRKSDCKHCYDVETKPRAELISRVLNTLPANGSPWCQYCLIGEVDSVDHYVPKNLFPEFSVLPRNLVASCPKCNRLKNAKWLRNGVREIISLYYDDLPALRYLFVDVTYPDLNRAKVAFRLQHTAGIALPLFNRIVRQFEILELIERYRKAGIWYLSEAIRSSGGMTQAAIVDAFNKDIATQHALCGVNHCKAVLYEALSTSNEFMALVNAT